MKTPGSAEAIQNGCKCPRDENHDGEGLKRMAGTDRGQVYYLVHSDCPVHLVSK